MEKFVITPKAVDLFNDYKRRRFLRFNLFIQFACSYFPAFVWRCTA